MSTFELDRNVVESYARDGVACVRGVLEPAQIERAVAGIDRVLVNVDGRGVSAWIPVDPVPEGACLEVLAGSHLGPWLMPRTFLAGEAKWFPEGALAELRTSRQTGLPSTSGTTTWHRAMPSFSISLPYTAHQDFRFPGAGGCCRCAICPRARGMRLAAGGRRRRSRDWTPNWRPAGRWIIRCSRWCGRARADRRRADLRGVVG